MRKFKIIKLTQIGTGIEVSVNAHEILAYAALEGYTKVAFSSGHLKVKESPETITKRIQKKR